MYTAKGSKAQLGADLVKEFDANYIQGNTVVSLRSSRDIQEVWLSVLKVTLRCDGLRKESQSGTAVKKQPNKSTQEESDDDEDSGVTKKKKKSEERSRLKTR